MVLRSLLCGFATLCLGGYGFADTYTVCPSGCDYTSIQEAIDASGSGDTILVAPGTYTGSGNQVVDFNGKTITLQSTGSALDTIIDGEGSRRGILFDSGESSDVLVEGFTIQHCTSTSPRPNRGAGIYCGTGCSPQIVDCRIINNTVVVDGGGFYCIGGSPQLTGCEISGNNAASYGGGGLYCDNLSTPSLIDCVISNNQAKWGGGIELNGGTVATLDGCTISGNTAEGIGGGMDCTVGSSAMLTDCVFVLNTAGDDGGGLCCDTSGTVTMTGCTFTSNTALTEGDDNKGGGAAFYNSTVDATSCTFTSNEAGDDGGGVYLYQCDAQFVLCNFINNESVMDGGGLRQVGGGDGIGSLQLTECTFTGNQTTGNEGRGGAVQVQEFGNCTLTECTFTANIAGDRGGALQALDASGTMMSCILDSNSVDSADDDAQGGGIFIEREAGTDWEFQSCTITNNVSEGSGGGLYVFEADAIFTDCDIIGNESLYGAGGGIRFFGSNSTLTNSTLSNNSCTGNGGGLVTDGGGPCLIDGCLLSQNSAGLGGAAYFHTGGAELSNTTVCGNQPTPQVDGVGYVDGGGNAITEECPESYACCLGGVCTDLETSEACTAAGGLFYDGFSCSDVTCPSGTLTVCADGCDFTEIQAAIDYSVAGDVIEIGEGVYTGVGDAVITLPSHAVTLRGTQGAAVTIIDAQGERRGIIMASGAGANAVQWTSDEGGNDHWYEFIAQDGNWDVHDALARDAGAHLVTITSQAENDFVEAVRDAAVPDQEVNGGAFLTGGLQPEGSPEPDGNWQWVTGEPFVYSNWGTTYDGIPQPDNDGDQNRIGLQWQDNGIWGDQLETTEWHAIIEWDGPVAQTVIEGLTIRNGTATGGGGDGFGDGGGMLIGSGNPLIQDCVFEQNTADDEGGAIYAMDAALSLVNCTFESNHAVAKGGGVSLVRCATGEVSDCVFTDNMSADKAGGLMCHESHPSLSDCTFTGNEAYANGGGMFCWSSSPVISNCIFLSNVASVPWGTYSGGGALYNGNGSAPIVSDCVFESNFAGDEGTDDNRGDGGAVYNDASSPQFTDCEFLHNGADGGGGAMAAYSGASVSLVRCLFDDNNARVWGGTLHHQGADSTLDDCVVSNSEGGGEAPSAIMIYLGSWVQIYNSLIGPNDPSNGVTLYNGALTVGGTTFCGNNNDWHIITGSGVDDLGTNVFLDSCILGACCLAGQCTETYSSVSCTEQGGIWHEGLLCGDVTCPSGTLTVCASGCDFSDIQSAIDYSAPNDVIEIEAGVYTGTGDSIIELPAHGITLRGTVDGVGNPTTILDGEGTRRGLTGDGCGATGTIIENLVVRDGQASKGGGLYLNACSPVLQNCWFVSNTADLKGGGAAIYDSTVTFTDCVFQLNATASGGDGGGAFLSGCDSQFTSCTFDQNTASADGGGLRHLDGGSLVLDTCVFSGNKVVLLSGRGGGVQLQAIDASVVVVDTSFTSNEAVYGGGVFAINCPAAPPLTFNKCEFITNTANGSGGGVYLDGDVNAEFTGGCIFDGNIATGDVDDTAGKGGGLKAWDATVLIDGCIITNNEAVEGGGLWYHGCDSVELRSSILCGNTPENVAGDESNYTETDVIDAPTCGGNGISIWIGNAETSEFDEEENWMFDEVPGAGSQVHFGVDEVFQVDFSDDAVSLSLDVTAGDVTFDLAGNDYTIEDDDPDDAVRSNIRVEQIPDGEAFNASLTLVDSSESGAELSCDDNVDIANSIGSIGSINLIGDVSLSIQETMRVASYGDGFFLMQDGAQADMISLDVGLFSGSFGEIQLIGDSTRLAIESQLEIKNGRVELIDMPVLAVVDSGVALRRDGWLGGYGVIEGDVYNYGGTFELDSDPGGVLRGPVQGFQVTGKYKQKEGGKLLMKASNDATSFLEIGWLAELGGGLIVSQQEGTQPPSGEVYAILSASEIDGQFDVALMPDLSDSDLYMSLQYASQPGLRGADVVEIVIEDLVDDVDFNDLPAPELDGVPAALAVADFGGDGMVDDLAIALIDTAGNGSIQVFLNDNSDGWGPEQDIPMTGTFDPGELAAIDIDGDGDTDLVGTNSAEDTVFYIENDGQEPPTFLDPVYAETGAGPSGLAFLDIDVDQDGDTETVMFIACTDAGTVEQWNPIGTRGDRDFPFEKNEEDLAANLEDPIDIDPIDDNEDKDVALIVTLGGSDQVGIIGGLVGMHGSVMKLAVGTLPTNVATGRLDGDADVGFDIDAVTTNEGDGTISVLVGQDDGGGGVSFKPAVNLPVGGTPRSITLVDLDEDADLDIAVIIDNEAGGTAVVVLRNDTSSGSDTLLFAPAEVLEINGFPLMVDQGLIDSDQQPDLVTINEQESGRADIDDVPVSLVGNAFEPAMGACCIDDEPCKITTNTECDAWGGSEWLIGADCDACVGPLGPCCYADEPCEEEAYEDDCSAVGGTWLGAEATCDDCPEPECSADVDSNGAVDVVDLLAVISYWGPCDGGLCEAADIDDDGQVDVTDLLTVIAGWGPCLP